MKKRSAREIPDFSRHPPRQLGAHGTQPVTFRAAPPAAAAPRPATKPHGTSAKPGRRGQ